MKQSDRRRTSRERILEAAREVFFREDFTGANLDEVAEKAGLSKGSIYRYFTNKAGLYLRVLGEAGHEYERRLRELVEHNEPEHTVDRVLDIARFHLHFWLEHPDHHRIFWAVDNEQVIGELPREMLDKIENVWKRNVGLVHAVIEEGVRRGELMPCDAWTLAHTLYLFESTLIDQDQTRIRRRVRKQGLEESCLYIVGTLMRGVMVQGAGSQGRLHGLSDGRGRRGGGSPRRLRRGPRDVVRRPLGGAIRKRTSRSPRRRSARPGPDAPSRHPPTRHVRMDLPLVEAEHLPALSGAIPPKSGVSRATSRRRGPRSARPSGLVSARDRHRSPGASRPSCRPRRAPIGAPYASAVQREYESSTCNACGAIHSQSPSGSSETQRKVGP
ncbi:MAG: TetR/AcrR family transcriptional regulator [Planctomycetota bacterium]